MKKHLIRLVLALAALAIVGCPPPGSPATAPGSPSISAFPLSTEVIVTWPAVSGATSYNLYWKAGTTVSKSSGTLISGATSPQSVSPLTDETGYAFIVTAVNDVGESTASNLVLVMPTAAGSPATVTTFAGGGGLGGTASGHINDTGTAATFSSPSDVAATATKIFVADVNNHLIRQIDIASGAVTTLAGGGAGGTDAGHSNGTGTAATFNAPLGVATDGANVYVADLANNLIRQVVISSGVVTTLAGGGAGGTDPGNADGTGTAATFTAPYGVATDGTNVYVADTVNNLIRQINITSGVVTTLAGGGSVGGTASGNADGTGTAATFNGPRRLAIVGTDLYVTDGSNNTIRKIVISTGVVTTLAGGGSAGGTAAGHADGVGTAATFDSPYGIATDGTVLYVADQNNNLIRGITISSGAVATIAGGGSYGGILSGNADGTGPASIFSGANGVTLGGGFCFVADPGNHTIRKLVIP